MKKKLSIRKTFSHSIDLFEDNWQAYMSALTAMIVLSSMFYLFPTVFYGENGMLFTAEGGILGFVGFIFSTILQIGFIEITLELVRGNKFSFADLYKNITFKKFFIYITSLTLVMILVVLGLILFIIPGIFLATALYFVQYTAVENKKGPVEALVDSWKMTQGYRWKLFVLIIVLGLFNLVGLLAFVIGLIITIPISAIITASAYEQLRTKQLIGSRKKRAA